jgi:branched-chain amino acid transport system substrate-binding protein
MSDWYGSPGVTLAMARGQLTGTPMIIPNAGADELTGSQCAPNIFRTSFSNWQAGYGAGLMAKSIKLQKHFLKYAAGMEQTAALKKLLKSGVRCCPLTLPFPNMEPTSVNRGRCTQAYAVYVFVAGAS